MRFFKQRDEFDMNGFTILKQIVPEGVLEELSKLHTRLVVKNQAKSDQVLFTHTKAPKETPHLDVLMNQWLNPHRLDGCFSSKDCADFLNEIAEEFFKMEMNLYQDIVLSKAHSHQQFPWHQDSSYWPIEFKQGATFWIPLVDVDAQNGALELAKDSPSTPLSAVNLHTGERQDNSGYHSPERTFTAIMKKGDVLVIHPNTLHRSGRNNSEIPRTAYACIFLDTSAYWNHLIAPNHPMCKVTTNGHPLVQVGE